MASMVERHTPYTNGNSETTFEGCFWCGLARWNAALDAWMGYNEETEEWFPRDLIPYFDYWYETPNGVIYPYFLNIKNAEPLLRPYDYQDALDAWMWHLNLCALPTDAGPPGPQIGTEAYEPDFWYSSMLGMGTQEKMWFWWAYHPELAHLKADRLRRGTPAAKYEGRAYPGTWSRG